MPEEVGRRALLMGAGCGVLALLGACSPSSPSAAPTAAPTHANALPSGALAKVADVPVGGGVVSADGVLVMQLKAGEFTAFDAACPHQQFTVQPPDSSGIITCRGHNSHFKASDGSVIDGPAFRGLTPIAVKVSGDEVVRA
jgi:nitrite reductase/ring-hydroxylating ferredoxin subunit